MADSAPSRRTGTESLATAGLVSMGGAVLASTLGYVVTAVVGRGLGETGTGEVFAVVSVVTILSNVLELGADTGLVRFTSRQRALGQTRLVRPTVRAAVLPVVLVSVPVLALAAWLVPGLRAVAGCVLAASLLQVLLGGTRGLGSVLPYALVANVGLPVVRLALVGGAVAAGLGSAGVLAAWALPFVVLVGPAALVLRRAVARAETPGGAEAAGPGDAASSAEVAEVRREFWRFSGVRGVAAAVEVVLEWSDVLLVGLLAGPAEAGVYTVVTRSLRAGQVVDQAVRVAVSPTVSAALGRGDHDRAEQVYTEVARAMILLQWPFYLVLAVFGPLVLGVFGAGFVRGAPAMSVMSAAVMVAAAAGTVQTFLLMGGRSHWQLANKSVVLGASVLGNLVLVPVAGVMGAAVVWATATVLDTGLGLWRVRRGLGVRAQSRPLLLPALVPLVVVGLGGLALRAVVGATGAAALAAVGVLAVVYVAVCLLLRRPLGIDAYVVSALGALRRRSRPHPDAPDPAPRPRRRLRTRPEERAPMDHPRPDDLRLSVLYGQPAPAGLGPGGHRLVVETLGSTVPGSVPPPADVEGTVVLGRPVPRGGLGRGSTDIAWPAVVTAPTTVPVGWPEPDPEWDLGSGQSVSAGGRGVLLTVGATTASTGRTLQADRPTRAQTDGPTRAQPGLDGPAPVRPVLDGPATDRPAPARSAAPLDGDEPLPTPWRAVARTFLVASVTGDVVVVGGATWAATAVVSLLKGHDMLVRTSMLASLVAVLGWVAVVAATDGYGVRRPGYRGGAFREPLVGALVVFLLLAALRGVWDVGLPVGVIVATPLLALVGGLGQRLLVREAIRRARQRGAWLARAVVVSESSRSDLLVERLQHRTGHGMAVLGLCADGADDHPPAGIPVLGTVEQTCDVARRLSADVVVIDCDELQPDALRRLLWQLEQRGLAAVVAPPMLEIDPSRLSLLPTMDATLLGVQLAGRPSGWIVKTVVDRALGSLLLLLLAPVLLVLVAAVALTSPGPVFFRQVRVGRHGREFRMWKLRTMYQDAEARKSALLASSEGAGLLFKMKDDPRVTPVGRLLRRFSLDELPQLVNVLLGDMALVGPRPALPQEVAEYDWSVSQRLKVRPGMTGLWQVSGRSDLSWEESVRLDLRYADNWSVPMDVAILAATVRAVLGGRGAY